MLTVNLLRTFESPVFVHMSMYFLSNINLTSLDFKSLSYVLSFCSRYFFKGLVFLCLPSPLFALFNLMSKICDQIFWHDTMAFFTSFIPYFIFKTCIHVFILLFFLGFFALLKTLCRKLITEFICSW